MSGYSSATFGRLSPAAAAQIAKDRALTARTAASGLGVPADTEPWNSSSVQGSSRRFGEIGDVRTPRGDLLDRKGWLEGLLQGKRLPQPDDVTLAVHEMVHLGYAPASMLDKFRSGSWRR